jgi:hypothetical protein
MKLRNEPIREIANLRNLAHLKLTCCEELISLSDLPEMQVLFLNNCPNVSSISNMKNLRLLTVESSNVLNVSNCSHRAVIQFDDCEFRNIPDCNITESVHVRRCGNLTDLSGLRNVSKITFDSCNLHDINLMPISNANYLQFKNMRLNVRDDTVVFKASSIVIDYCEISSLFWVKSSNVKSFLLNNCHVANFHSDMKTEKIKIINCGFVQYPLVFPNDLTHLMLRNTSYSNEQVYNPAVPCMISNLSKLVELKIEKCTLKLKVLRNLTSLERLFVLSTTEYHDKQIYKINTNPRTIVARCTDDGDYYDLSQSC